MKKIDKMSEEKSKTDGGKLVIVESPAKARTIGKILGQDYTLMASMGHVRDLPEKTIGVDIKNDFLPLYQTTKKKVLKELCDAAKKSKIIYLATDPDREGEAIAWHLKEVLSKKTKGGFSRVEFHEITPKAILHAFESPREIDVDLVNSQQARRVLDRLVGYQVSPLLWSKIEKRISAGRVQSVALRIVCEREREILAFVPKEYWIFEADLSRAANASHELLSKLVKINNKKADVPNKKAADKVIGDLKSVNDYEVSLVKEETLKKHAPPPFITSTLQQAAGSSLRFGASRTMQIAQQLYEGVEGKSGETSGLITYMRTDSFSISKDAQSICLSYIEEKFGKEFVPQKPNFYKNKSTAQEAHEAIRPTDVTHTPESLKDSLTNDQYRLYRIIWKRFVASQMAHAKIGRKTVELAASPQSGDVYTLRTTASVITFPGYMKVTGKEQDSSETGKSMDFLLSLEKGEKFNLLELREEQKFTEPPSRFSEPSLIRELEANGIGRPSTYAAIVNTIQKRKYVKLEKGKLLPEDLGFRVNDYLVGSLPTLFDIGFTAEMETKLDKIEEGSEEWTSMLREFYDNMSGCITEAKYESAPDTSYVEGLFSLLDTIEKWEEPVKIGRRVYDDQKFLASVKKQFEKNKKLSEKQWTSLLSLSIKYTSSLPELDSIAKEYGFTEALAEARIVYKQAEEDRKIKGEESKKNGGIVISSLSYFDSATFPEPVEGAKRFFDEKSFLESLKGRAENGQPFSDKQMNALKRIAINHRNEIKNFKGLSDLLGITEDDLNGGKKIDPEKAAKEEIELKNLFSALEKISSWEKPAQKTGKKTNDKDFYLSLSDHYKRKGVLSFRQKGALIRLVSKYSGANNEEK